jgi:hypothetical protein
MIIKSKEMDAEKSILYVDSNRGGLAKKVKDALEKEFNCEVFHYRNTFKAYDVFAEGKYSVAMFGAGVKPVNTVTTQELSNNLAIYDDHVVRIGLSPGKRILKGVDENMVLPNNPTKEEFDRVIKGIGKYL